MKYTIILLLFPLFSYSQRIKTPVWSQSFMFFETAKIRSFDNKTKKWGPETFKTCKISFGDEDMASLFTIDMPDRFYIKDAEVYSITYDLNKDNVSNISYVLNKEKTICVVAFYFSVGSEKPDRIMVTITDNLDKPAHKTYALTELKN